tara:strand:+ start:2820 stop:3509 length:690 start_codon:yes stop_codon:yes gene_type:complete
MVYFLGRDVEVFVTTESVVANKGVGVASLKADVTTDSNATFPSMTDAASISGGLLSDVTGVDVSIGISDEDTGPFFGQVSTGKVQLRNENTVTITKKKTNDDFDILFNGPSQSTRYAGSAADANRMGARYGLEYDGSNWVVGDGRTNPKFITGATAANRPYGYRVHVRLKNAAAGPVYTLRGCSWTGHTLSLNADGASDETLEFASSVQPLTITGANTFASGALAAGDM